MFFRENVDFGNLRSTIFGHSCGNLSQIRTHLLSFRVTIIVILLHWWTDFYKWALFDECELYSSVSELMMFLHNKLGCSGKCSRGKILVFRTSKRYFRAFWRKFAAITTLNGIFLILLGLACKNFFSGIFACMNIFLYFPQPPYHFSNGRSLKGMVFQPFWS